METILVILLSTTLIACGGLFKTKDRSKDKPITTSENTPGTSTPQEPQKPEIPTVPPVTPPEQPETPTPVEPDPKNPRVVMQLKCEGNGPGWTKTKVEVMFYDDLNRKYFVKIWERERTYEDFDTFEVPGVTTWYWPLPKGPNLVLSTKVQHGFDSNYRTKLGYGEDARIYIQLHRAEDGEAIVATIGQLGEPSKPEFWGLSKLGCEEVPVL